MLELTPEDRASTTDLALIHINRKQALLAEIFQGTLPGQIVTSLWRWESLGAPGPFCCPTSDCYVTVFYSYHYCKTVGFQGYCRNEERMVGIVPGKILQSLLFLQGFSHINIPWLWQAIG